MSSVPGQTLRHAERLLRWYPKDWRARYGEEFAELLVADISEQPRSWRRDLDVVFAGLAARLAGTGLSGNRLEPAEAARRRLVTFGCAMAVFVALGVAVWSQVTVDWQWSAPAALTTSVAMVMMSGAAALLSALTLAAAVPLAWAVGVRAVRHHARGLACPALVFLLSVTVLVVGARHFGNGWPGTGGHPWPHQGLVPGGVAAFLWAATLSVSAYWAHPAALLSFPVSEVAWMVASPAALACLVAGAAMTVRRLSLSPAALRYQAWLGRIATVAMVVFLAGVVTWVSYGGPGPRNLFHAGVIDLGALSLMTMALAVASQAAFRDRPTGPSFALGEKG